MNDGTTSVANKKIKFLNNDTQSDQFLPENFLGFKQDIWIMQDQGGTR